MTDSAALRFELDGEEVVIGIQARMSIREFLLIAEQISRSGGRLRCVTAEPPALPGEMEPDDDRA